MEDTSNRVLNFSSMEEFSNLFKKDNIQVTNLIFEGIEEGIKFQKKTAHLFLIQFDDEDEYGFDVVLPRNQWQQALEKCLENYQNWDEGDRAIDTYLLLKEVKSWDTEK